MSSVERNNKLLKELFTVFLIASIITVFEMIFYIVLVRPIAIEKVMEFINNVDLPAMNSFDDLLNKIKNLTEILDKTYNDLDSLYTSINNFKNNSLIPYELKIILQESLDDITNTKKNITDVQNELGNTSIKKNLVRSILEKIQQFLDSFKKRESELISGLSVYTYILVALEVLILYMITYYIYTKTKGSLSSPLFSTFIVVFVIGSFQYLFYKFGLRYNYTGKYGFEEVQYYFINSLK